MFRYNLTFYEYFTTKILDKTPLNISVFPLKPLHKALSENNTTEVQKVIASSLGEGCLLDSDKKWLLDWLTAVNTNSANVQYSCNTLGQLIELSSKAPQLSAVYVMFNPDKIKTFAQNATKKQLLDILTTSQPTAFLILNTTSTNPNILALRRLTKLYSKREIILLHKEGKLNLNSDQTQESFNNLKKELNAAKAEIKSLKIEIKNLKNEVTYPTNKNNNSGNQGEMFSPPTELNLSQFKK